jgi:hypothetical protein
VRLLISPCPDPVRFHLEDARAFSLSLFRRGTDRAGRISFSIAFAKRPPLAVSTRDGFTRTSSAISNIADRRRFAISERTDRSGPSPHALGQRSKVPARVPDSAILYREDQRQLTQNHEDKALVASHGDLQAEGRRFDPGTLH